MLYIPQNDGSLPALLCSLIGHCSAWRTDIPTESKCHPRTPVRLPAPTNCLLAPPIGPSLTPNFQSRNGYSCLRRNGMIRKARVTARFNSTPKGVLVSSSAPDDPHFKRDVALKIFTHGLSPAEPSASAAAGGHHNIIAIHRQGGLEVRGIQYPYHEVEFARLGNLRQFMQSSSCTVRTCSMYYTRHRLSSLSPARTESADSAPRYSTRKYSHIRW